jgi:hypothetical protein
MDMQENMVARMQRCETMKSLGMPISLTCWLLVAIQESSDGLAIGNHPV